MASLDNHYKSYIAYNIDRLACVNKWTMPIKMGVVGDGRIYKFLVITIAVSNLVKMYTCYAMPLHYF